MFVLHGWDVSGKRSAIKGGKCGAIRELVPGYSMRDLIQGHRVLMRSIRGERAAPGSLAPVRLTPKW